MNAYDFDGTIYDGDSSIDFVAFCMRRHPSLFGRLPAMAAAGARYRLGRIDKTAMKQVFFAFLGKLDDCDAEVRAFWDANFRKIKGWYIEQRRCDDLIISASPEFMLEEACARLGLTNLLASRVDKGTGVFDGPNCRGEEKVRRFHAAFPKATIENFYSDSVKADWPMAALAQQAWLVTGDTIEPWPDSKS